MNVWRSAWIFFLIAMAGIFWLRFFGSYTPLLQSGIPPEQRAGTLWWAQANPHKTDKTSLGVEAVGRLDGSYFDAAYPPVGIFLANLWNRLDDNVDLFVGPLLLNGFALVLIALAPCPPGKRSYLPPMIAGLAITSPALASHSISTVTVTDFFLLFFGFLIFGLSRAPRLAGLTMFAIGAIALPMVSYSGTILALVATLLIFRKVRNESRPTDFQRAGLIGISFLPTVFVGFWLTLASRHPGTVFGDVLGIWSGSGHRDILSLFRGLEAFWETGWGLGFLALFAGAFLAGSRQSRSRSEKPQRVEKYLILSAVYAAVVLLSPESEFVAEPSVYFATVPFMMLFVTAEMLRVSEGPRGWIGEHQKILFGLPAILIIGNFIQIYFGNHLAQP